MTKEDLLIELRAIAASLAEVNIRKTKADAAIFGYLKDPEITQAWIDAGGVSGRQSTMRATPIPAELVERGNR